jgi:hypothetical protein
MAKMTITVGSCPVCGREVARTVTTHHGLLLEHTSCPVHGRRERAPADATVSQWVVAPSLAAIGEMLGEPIPAGVEWVR